MRGAILCPLLVAIVVLTGCARGAPPGFSSGSSWSAPLVAPLEPGRLLTPVLVQGRGPYLFTLDPDAPITVIDVGIADELGLDRLGAMRVLDESDTTRPISTARVTSLQVGDLTVSGSRAVGLVRKGALAISGWPIRGVLGRDVLADSLVFGFDRDAGRAYLTTQEGFTPRQGAATLAFQLLPYQDQNINSSFVRPGQPAVLSRRVTSVDVGGAPMRMHIGLGGWNTRLRAATWPKAGARPTVVHAVTIDEIAMLRTIDQGAAVSVQTGADAVEVLALAYGEKRWEKIDGALGLDAFAARVVMANWHRKTVYVSPRTEIDPADRMARWRDVLGVCATTTGCATVSVRGTVITVLRAGALGPLELLLEITDAEGHVIGHRTASLPAGAGGVSGPAPAGAAQARVLDVHPFPHACPGIGRCITEAVVVP